MCSRLTLPALLALVLMAMPSLAQSQAPGPMTGEALHAALRSLPPNDPEAHSARQRAAAYIEAVQQGAPRCPGPRLKPHERDARVYEHLNDLPAVTRLGDAAPLVRDALRC